MSSFGLDVMMQQLLEAFQQGKANWNKIIERGMTDIGIDAVAVIKAKTPVGQYTDGRTGGTLRGNWFSEVNTDTSMPKIEIINNIEYAAWVNDGHRIRRNGKTVGEVPGQFFLEKGLIEVWEDIMPKVVDRMFKELGEVMSS